MVGADCHSTAGAIRQKRDTSLMLCQCQGRGLKFLAFSQAITLECICCVGTAPAELGAKFAETRMRTGGLSRMGFEEEQVERPKQHELFIRFAGSSRYTNTNVDKWSTPPQHLIPCLVYPPSSVLSVPTSFAHSNWALRARRPMSTFSGVLHPPVL